MNKRQRQQLLDIKEHVEAASIDVYRLYEDDKSDDLGLEVMLLDVVDKLDEARTTQLLELRQGTDQDRAPDLRAVRL